MSTFSIKGQLVNIMEQSISPSEITIKDGKISSITPIDSAPEHYLMPGFIDAHVHVESSMLIPSEFARLAVVHGTVATVSDPHEIANVCGKEGVDYMIENGKKVNFNFYFGAPSCVPATPFETAGGEITADDIDELLSRKEVAYLAEMMNWPGVINKDPAVLEKIAVAAKHQKPVDGHAPGLKGDAAKKYIAAGISTDHECFTEEEALSKLQHGMKIIIREGSAAKNFDALIDLMDKNADNVMFCSDDKHPDNLAIGHINQLVARAVSKGKNMFNVLKAACLNPIAHYRMDVGQLKLGDPADFICCKNLTDFEVAATYIKGQKVAENGKSLISSVTTSPINNFDTSLKKPEDFRLKASSSLARIIEAKDGQLITNELVAAILVKDGFAEANVAEDILKFTVVNRYQDAAPAMAFIKNFGIKEGAIASSVGHDSHNILAVGTDDGAIAKAVNMVIREKGGIAAVSAAESLILPLPIAGIMSADDGYEVAKAYTEIDRLAKKMGATLDSPFMTLSFMALLVIPALKLSDKGLFDGSNFQFTTVFHPKN
ncbi:adenine deaminase [Echinicola rosea]|uniref:Adenine deaminase n=1 Tax=Echinicola rosea TaxID=1807691 RepID=A0ABQ1UKV4_9BACT|nr:adenine deaminase [Echinicola rosea]GGF19238.1 adenine deaminase [Echinicola rosea]